MIPQEPPRDNPVVDAPTPNAPIEQPRGTNTEAAVLEQYPSRIQELEDDVQKLHADAKLSADRISDLETREAMQMLERWICFKFACSKTCFQQKFYNLDKIDTKSDTAVKAGLASELTSHGLTPTTWISLFI